MTKLPWPSGNFLLSPYYPRMRFLMPLNLSLSNAPEEVAPVYKYFEETYVLHVGKPVATRVKRRGIPAYHMQDITHHAFLPSYGAFYICKRITSQIQTTASKPGTDDFKLLLNATTFLFSRP